MQQPSNHIIFDLNRARTIQKSDMNNVQKLQIGDQSMEEISLYNNGGMQKRTKWIIAGTVVGVALVAIVVCKY